MIYVPGMKGTAVSIIATT